MVTSDGEVGVMRTQKRTQKTLSTNPRHHYVMGIGREVNRLQVEWHPGKRWDCNKCSLSKNGNAAPDNIPLPKGWYT
jgi:hypothetical protein